MVEQGLTCLSQSIGSVGVAPGWPILPPAAALRPDRLASEAGRQAIHGLAAGCGRPVRSPTGLILRPAGPSRCSLRQNRPALPPAEPTSLLPGRMRPVLPSGRIDQPSLRQNRPALPTGRTDQPSLRQNRPAFPRQCDQYSLGRISRPCYRRTGQLGQPWLCCPSSVVVPVGG